MKEQWQSRTICEIVQFEKMRVSNCISAGKTGSCFPDEGANVRSMSSASRCRIRAKKPSSVRRSGNGLPIQQKEGIFSMSQSKGKVWRLCRTAMFAALYVLLNLVSIKAGNLRITFSSLPVVVSGLLFGPADAVLTALGGEFLNQMLSYGFSPTTLLWMLPPAVRGLLVGMAAVSLRRNGRPLESRPVLCYAVCIAAALGTTVANTAAMAVDAKLYGYYTKALVLGDFLWRVATGTLIAVIVTTAAIPLVHLLRRQVLSGRRLG